MFSRATGSPSVGMRATAAGTVVVGAMVEVVDSVGASLVTGWTVVAGGTVVTGTVVSSIWSNRSPNRSCSIAV